jgi:hypothetical protein
MNVLKITSTAMALVWMVQKFKCGIAMMNAYLEMSLVKMNVITFGTSTAMVFVSMDGK